MDNGYRVKIDARRVAPNAQIPHGIRYSLTLHDRYNRRVPGFDNAHATKPGSNLQSNSWKISGRKPNELWRRGDRR